MKQTIYMMFLIVCAIVMGSMLGGAVAGTEGLRFLAYSKTFEWYPGTLKLFDVLNLTFGISFYINVAQIILIIVAIIIYTKTAPKLFAKK